MTIPINQSLEAAPRWTAQTVGMGVKFWTEWSEPWRRCAKDCCERRRR